MAAQFSHACRCSLLRERVLVGRRKRSLVSKLRKAIRRGIRKDRKQADNELNRFESEKFIPTHALNGRGNEEVSFAAARGTNGKSKAANHESSGAS